MLKSYPKQRLLNLTLNSRKWKDENYQRGKRQLHLVSLCKVRVPSCGCLPQKNTPSPPYIRQQNSLTLTENASHTLYIHDALSLKPRHCLQVWELHGQCTHIHMVVHQSAHTHTHSRDWSLSEQKRSNCIGCQRPHTLAHTLTHSLRKQILFLTFPGHFRVWDSFGFWLPFFSFSLSLLTLSDDRE